MELVWLGHSCFRLRTDKSVILTDPFPDGVGLSMGVVQALAVTISHGHPSHSNSQGVDGEPMLLDGPGEYELSGIYVTGVMTPAGEGDPAGKRNTAYLIEMENLRICHLGDVSTALATRQVEALSPVDVLLVPAGGGCTVTASQALEMVRRLEPRIVVPMHYKPAGLPGPLGDSGPFLRELGLREVEPQARLSVTVTSLPPEMRVVVLEPQGVRVQPTLL